MRLKLNQNDPRDFEYKPSAYATSHLQQNEWGTYQYGRLFWSKMPGVPSNLDKALTSLFLQVLTYFIIQLTYVWTEVGPLLSNEVNFTHCQPVLRAFCSISGRKILLKYPVSVIEHSSNKRFHKICEECISINKCIHFYASLSKIYLN